MTDKPLVTVLIDTYNHEKFIEQAIVSVLEQDLDPDDVEIVVIDDGSTDNTAKIANKFGSRVRYIYKPNGGQASAFNLGIPAARGDIIAFLDGDDWWEKTKLSTVLSLLDRHPEIGAVGHSITEMYADGKERLVAPSTPVQIHHLQTASSALNFRRVKCLFGTSRFTARKNILMQVLPIPDRLTVEADEYMWTITAAITQVVAIDRSLTNYRLHAGNLYQIQHYDRQKLQRKYQVIDGLVQTLPPKLARLGISSEAIDITIEPLWIEAERLRLSLQGGTPWQTFVVERAAYKLALKEEKRHETFKYHLFKNLTFGLALFMSPQFFYQIRDKYGNVSNDRQSRQTPNATTTLLS